ncbi:MAG: hypothetical protein LBR11_11700 [Deltaproteobacteria bacterium]|jgi:hypothetical protein|nr:hypothetical protein [Deltaproteobacteria bacterium]
MFVSSDFLAYVGRKKIERPVYARPPLEASLESSPGGQQKNTPPIKPTPPRLATRSEEEVDYLNARDSTFEVIL